jgi:CelD/BcsL family acetyltransferase involved in cellulose biosynthesis
MGKTLNLTARYGRVTWTSPTLTAAPAPLDQIVGDWTALARALPQSIPFDHPAWHRAWWAHFGGSRSPIYLALHDGETFTGVLPLMQAGDTVTIAGDPEICDYTSFPIHAGPHEDVPPELFGAVDALPWRTFHVWGLPEDAAALPALRRWGEARGYHVEEDFEAVCPRIALPPDWDAYLASLGKKDRHELRRKMRRFEQAGAEVAVRTFCSEAEVNAALATFFHLHRVSHRGKAVFMTADMEAFFRAMACGLAAEGIVRLVQIDIDGTAVASLLGFVAGDELLLYNSGYDPAYATASVGIVSKALTIQAAIADGFSAFDFLRGAEPYKYDLGAVDRIVRQVWITRDV